MQNNSNTSHIVKEMLTLAIAAQQKAYSPYSDFKVGACIRANNGKLYHGCNIENVSYPLTMCAEAAAIATMISDGAKEILEIVIVGSADQPCSPCGACRQKLREFANPQLLVHMYGQHGDSLTMPLTELLPVSFGPEFLRNS